MRVLYVAAEVFPLAKTGGLADVSAALPAAMRESGVDVRLLMPGYPQALDTAKGLRLASVIEDPLGVGQVRIWKGTVPNGSVPVWLIDCPPLFDRGGNPYQDEQGCDFPDNALRFGLLSHIGALATTGAARLGWRPDLVHVNDWHTALLPLMLRLRAGPRPPTLLAIHNLAYQGVFPADVLPRLALPDRGDAFAAVETGGRMSFLKAGICSADQLTTVSPTHAAEIQTAEYGWGLEDLLRRRAATIHGILNGVDYNIWNPARDPYLHARYDAADMSNKQACKRSVQEALGLETKAEAPLVGFLSRLAWQKMPDVVLEALPALLAEGIQFALVAEGDRGYEAGFHQLAAAYPSQVGVRIGYEEPIAHQLMAGADMMLSPARYEPCGLTAIYALRYGTPPIARRTGGLADSIVDAGPSSLADRSATGFLFDDPSVGGLVGTTRRALQLYQQKLPWRRIQIAGMRKDHGWRRAAQEYLAVYQRMTSALVKPLRLPDRATKRLVA